MKNYKTPKVLLVDDDESFFNLLKLKMAKQNFLFLWAKDGQDGINKALDELPDLIITDIVMPKINGFELLKELKNKALTCQLKYMVLSNYGQAKRIYDTEFLESLGICKYLVKSNYTPSEIVREIQEAIG